MAWQDQPLIRILGASKVFAKPMQACLSGRAPAQPQQGDRAEFGVDDASGFDVAGTLASHPGRNVGVRSGKRVQLAARAINLDFGRGGLMGRRGPA